jgi:hypothetical protein
VEIPAAGFGGTAPLVATALVAWANSSPWPVGVYLMVLSALGAVSILCMPETLRRERTRRERSRW